MSIYIHTPPTNLEYKVLAEDGRLAYYLSIDMEEEKVKIQTPGRTSNNAISIPIIAIKSIKDVLEDAERYLKLKKETEEEIAYEAKTK